MLPKKVAKLLTFLKIYETVQRKTIQRSVSTGSRSLGS